MIIQPADFLKNLQEFNVTYGGGGGGGGCSGPEQLVYVAQDGADLVGNGSECTPYLTLSFAMSQITDASVTKPYEIFIVTGDYNEAIPAMKPNVYINGNGSTAFYSGSLVLDASWGAQPNSICVFRNFARIDFDSGMNLNFDSVGATNAIFVFKDLGESAPQSWTFTGNLASTSKVFLSNIFADIITSSPNFALNNINALVNNCEANLINISNNSANDYNVFVQTSRLTSISPVISGTGNTVVESYNNKMTSLGNTTSSTGTCIVNSVGDDISSSITVSGAAATTNVDRLTLVPSILAGGTINYPSLASGVTANVPDPTNYVPITPQIAGHLEGIDAALLSPLDFAAQVVYVAQDGIDTVGRGPINAPYATISFAMSQIIDASPTKPYTIQVITGDYNEGGIACKPNVYINGGGSTFEFSGVAALDATWTSSPNSFLVIQDFASLKFQAGVSFNFNSVAAVNAKLFMRNIEDLDSTTWILQGNTSSPTEIHLDAIKAEATAPDFAIVNFNGSINNSEVDFIIALNTSSVNQVFLLKNCEFNDVILQASGTGDLSTLYSNNSTKNLSTVAGTSTAIITNTVCASKITGSNTVNGGTGAGTAILNIDLINMVPNQINSPTINYTSISDGMTANYTPSNYSAATPEVAGHLEGIDIALSSSAQDLQSTYDNSASGIITMAAGKHFGAQATDAALYVPQMTTAQFSAISTPPKGLLAGVTMIKDTT